MSRITRNLSNNLGDSAMIFIEYPVESSKSSPEYICTVGIEKQSGPVIEKVYGLGEIQALYCGMMRLSALIDRINEKLDVGQRWFWSGGMNKDDFGLPKFISED